MQRYNSRSSLRNDPGLQRLKMFDWDIPGNTNLGERLSTVDLLIKVAHSVKE
jgi:hypothetical protein